MNAWNVEELERPAEDTLPTLDHGVVERVMSGGYIDVRLADAVRVCHISANLRRAGVTVREGDRVTVITTKDGVFLGEITQVRPGLAPPSFEPGPRRSILVGPTPKLKPQDQRLDRAVRPGWPTAAECPPEAGDEAYCTAGAARVLRVLGRTGNGSRLLELVVPAQPRVSFFAAASNVLIAPRKNEECLDASG